ncbi:MAG: universal stress protein [Bacteroidia bacterium]|nr:universal stress protein [Bacteroidia bacterium]NNF81545.1 universal stress protein [Flavobacteriaceae bacterium]NNL80835.1 universal stress protein [Flavobacteriaceae bacterium]
MRRILLPTDFSENSINAIDYAVELFKDVICQFYILNVQKASSFISDDIRSMSPSTTIYQSLIADSKTRINEIIIKLESGKNKNHHFNSMVDYDNFIDAINQACMAKNIDLIVMGTKGATGSNRVLFGGNTIRVIQRGMVPVLAVPEEYEFNGLDKIAFTSNYLTHYKESELTPLMQLAELYQSRIDVLHMTQDDQFSSEQNINRDFLDCCFRFVDHTFIDLDKKDIFDAVSDYIHENDIKLLAMMSRKHSFFKRLFSRQNVETFAFKIDIPLLVMENTTKVMERSN